MIKQAISNGWKARSTVLSGAVIGAFLLLHVLVISYAVDVPYMDEWETLNPGNLGRKLNLSWVFAPHNEHRIIPTKIQMWLHYVFGQWNLTANASTSLWIYFGLVWMCVSCASKLAGSNLVLLALPFATALNWANIIVPFQSQFHFFLLFFLASIWVRLNSKKPDLALVFVWLTVYSFSSGLFCALAYIGLNLVLLFFSQERKRSLLHICVSVGIILVWFTGYSKNALHPEYTWPNELIFWSYYLNILSFGFGYTQDSQAQGLVILLVLLGGILWLGLRAYYRTRQPGLGRLELTPEWRKTLVLATWAAGILLGLASITLGRAGFGVEHAKSSRYAEVGLVLVPVVAVIFFSVLSEIFARRPPLLMLGKVMTLGVLLYPSVTGPSFALAAKQHASGMLAGARCIQRYYAGEIKEALCPTIYPWPIDSRLEEAKRLKVSFTDRLHEGM